MCKNEIEVTEMNRSGYTPLVAYEAWRVAVLNYCDDVRPENIHTMQKHNFTDEVFVLLSGHCTLYTGGCGDTPGAVTVHPMVPGKVYNIKKGCWHNHVLNESGSVLIIENDDTYDGGDNSPILPLNEEQMQAVCDGWNE